MKGNFIPHPTMPGEGRCRVCDLPYSTLIPKEIAGHRRFHRDYLRACDGVGAPVPEDLRERWKTAGLASQFAVGAPLADRLAAAEMWLEGVYHDYLFGVLLHQAPRRMDLREFFTARVEGRGRLSNFQADVAHELLLRYSDYFMP